VLVVLWDREGWPRRHMTARHYAALAGLIAAVGRGDEPDQAALDLPGGVRARVAAPARGQRAPLPQPAHGTAAALAARQRGR
jgi:hypothetical protein